MSSLCISTFKCDKCGTTIREGSTEAIGNGRGRARRRSTTSTTPNIAVLIASNLHSSLIHTGSTVCKALGAADPSLQISLTRFSRLSNIYNDRKIYCHILISLSLRGLLRGETTCNALRGSAFSLASMSPGQAQTNDRTMICRSLYQLIIPYCIIRLRRFYLSFVFY